MYKWEGNECQRHAGLGIVNLFCTVKHVGIDDHCIEDAHYTHPSLLYQLTLQYEAKFRHVDLHLILKIHSVNRKVALFKIRFAFTGIISRL